jgi:type 1 glutamine amidotransferase
MKTGVLCGDRWHPAEVVREGLEPLRTDSTQFEFSIDPEEWSLDRMKQYDVLVLSKSNGKPEPRAAHEDPDWLTDAVQQNFVQYVENGGGLLICHSGTVGYQNRPLFLGLVGGVFLHHPPHCSVTLEYHGDFGREKDDPRTFKIHDEHYFVETAPDNLTFLTSTSENGTQPAGWTRRQGKGRVCVLTPGHFPDVWTHPVYQHTLRYALDWCAARESVT